MVKRLTFLTALMLAVPVVLWAMGWQWTGDQHLTHGIDDFLYFLTETGSVPYALITCVFLMFWVMYLTRKHYSWVLVGAICASSVLGTQVVKTVAKQFFAEPRPYVTQMMGEQSEQFYELTRDQRAMIVADYYKESEFPLIANHRANETGYSFPSGHAIFSVSWLLVFGGLLFRTREQKQAVNKTMRVASFFALTVMTIWSALMLISRIRFGMHYPMDLFASTILAWLFHLVLFLWLVPRVQDWALFEKIEKMFKKRG